MARLQPIADGLWTVEHDLYMYGFIHFRGRMTVVRLPEGELLLHSVVPIDDALAQELQALGPVAHLVAPNRLHHVHLGDGTKRYPKAKVWGAPGLAKKRRDLSFDGVLGEQDAPWEAAFEPLQLQGNRWISEVVFLHRDSGTLVVTDLVFNIREVSNVWTKWTLQSAGAFGRLTQSRLWRFTTRDRDAMRRSIEAMLQWEFDRVILAHGELLETGGREALSKALWWMRGRPSVPAAIAA